MVGLFATAGGVGSALGQGDEAATAQGRIDEIIVTATKRATSIQDTAMSISALSPDAIEKRGLVGLDDYLRTLPGLNMQDRGASRNSIVIRGIASDPENEDSAVGVYFGETPMIGLGEASGAAGTADLKFVDIDRIEVLRGPQGTLYGSSSMGGVVRIIPTKPKLNELQGKLATRYSSTSGQGGENSMVQGVINIPLVEDKLAVRAVAYRYDNSGYINNIAEDTPAALASAISFGGIADNKTDIGSDEYKGFRISAMWQPITELGIVLTHSNQDIEQDGFPEVNGGLSGKFEQVRLRTGPQGSRTEFLENSIAITNLKLDYELSWGTIMSSSSWLDYDASSETDWSHLITLPTFIGSEANTKSFIEEIRFSSNFDGDAQVLAGVYFEDYELNGSAPLAWSGDSANEVLIAQTFPPSLMFNTVHTSQNYLIATRQWALFGEISYSFTDRWTAILGGRYFDYDQKDKFDGFGAFFGGSFGWDRENNDSGQTYKLNISYSPNDDSLIYGQWTEGFRLGEPGRGTPSFCDVDQDGLVDGIGLSSDVVKPDELESYELGIKKSYLHDRVTLNAALYRINWEGMPLLLVPPCGVTFKANGGSSKSEGMEVELQAQISESIKLDMGASYNNSILTENVPGSGIGAAGDDLPGSADFNFTMGLEYNFDLSGNQSYIRADYSYVSEYHNSFDEMGTAAGDYAQVDLKAGIEIDEFSIDIFGKNLTNADEFTWVETFFGASGFNRAYRLRPRTIGLNIAYKF